MLIELSNGAKLSEETVIDALKKQGISIESAKPEFGDIVVFKDNRPGWIRVILYTESGKLWAFNKNSCKCGHPENYKKTGRTIFDNLTD